LIGSHFSSAELPDSTVYRRIAIDAAGKTAVAREGNSLRV
jgi:hypothetical protein